MELQDFVHEYSFFSIPRIHIGDLNRWMVLGVDFQRAIDSSTCEYWFVPQSLSVHNISEVGTTWRGLQFWSASPFGRPPPIGPPPHGFYFCSFVHFIWKLVLHNIFCLVFWLFWCIVNFIAGISELLSVDSCDVGNDEFVTYSAPKNHVCWWPCALLFEHLSANGILPKLTRSTSISVIRCFPWIWIWERMTAQIAFLFRLHVKVSAEIVHWCVLVFSRWLHISVGRSQFNYPRGISAAQ